MKRLVIVLFVAAVIAGSWYLYAQNGQEVKAERPEGITTTFVSEDSIAATISATGSIEPERTRSLAFASAGTVAEVLVEDGQFVEAEQLLARLDLQDLALAVEQAEAALRVSEAQLAKALTKSSEEEIAAAEAALASAEAQLEDLKAGASWREKELARLAIDQAKNSLYGAQGSRDAIKGSPVTSPGQRDTAEAQVLNAEIAVKIAELQYAQLFEEPKAGAIVAAEAQIAQSESTLERLRARPEPEDIALARAQVAQARVNVQIAQQRLDDVELRAPIAGRLTSWDLNVGDVVSPASPLGTLVDTTRYHVTVNIDETDIGQIAVGQETEIRVDAFPDVLLVGQVRDISLIGNNAQGIVAYDVRVDLQPTDLDIRPLMTVGVDVIVQRKADALLVSNRAIRRDQAGKYVEVLVENVPERVPITTGLTDGSNTEILEGLKVGQEVIVGRPREGLFGMGG